ncbi:FAD-dependent oxidoreductase [Labrys monachus]|uniref:NADPH-dependent 2,4-dienoyl-CoA reductase/sulfur reductase-like enzyme/nitrite reductase/ring-hydroxylating ferredoxin subunit n=1 Tax=Labrys monachus TaxID=217067 RepID=A0ABU0F7D9_9HYPH|nr:FAD-dependent oxidoreductase [Labrys monachus]MDQ0390532.1 NADPH-dependent 2,4-dienoyl-CoA reductase/sulfur reductase-like enzyme/nitrite reductase/ring-hydroxylating ferredoxin subunit [Labrys monachus]
MQDEPDTDLPDLTRGVPSARLAEGGLLTGRVGEEKVIVWRRGRDVAAYAAACPHLGGPLDEGLLEDGVVACPWHHACFDLRTGAAVAAPAFDALRRYPVAESRGVIVVTAPTGASNEPAAPALPSASRPDGPMAIIGGGAAGFAAADALRRNGWRGRIAMFSSDADEPYDRTLLTKDYLDGSFGDDRLPIARHGVEALGIAFEPNVRVESIDVPGRLVRLEDGRSEAYARLLLATGAEPRRPGLPGEGLPHVHLLRSLADCRRILADARTARHVVVLGGSFIGMEAAASLRSRGLAIDLVAPDSHPMEKIFGRALSDLVVDTYRRNGVTLHLGRKATAIAGDAITLDDGTTLPADLVVIGIGVEPRIELAESAGLAVDEGVLVDAHLRTSAPGIYAAGDICRWPDPHSGEAIRVEHWVVAERQGQAAAANMLGADRPFAMVPFFWTKHFDLAIRYVGHAERWDELVVEGDLSKRHALIRYRREGRDLAVATVGRDLDSLREERKMALAHAPSPWT